MDIELQEKLFAIAPKWFNRNPADAYYRDTQDARPSRMSDGFCCGNGWYPILRVLFEFLRDEQERWEKENPNATENPWKTFGIFQTKEKFGSLRVYEEHGWPEGTYAAVEFAERLSRVTCETCGKMPAESTMPKDDNGSGWILTLCSSCAVSEGRETWKERKERESK